MTTSLAERLLYIDDSPYERQSTSLTELGIDPSELGLPEDFEIEVERCTRAAEDVEEASRFFRTYGAAWISRDVPLPLPSSASSKASDTTTHDTLGQTLDHATTATIATLRHYADNPSVVKPKDYGAYNNTPRKMYSVSFQNVTNNFKPVMVLQEQLLPLVSAINHDPATQISVDPDEGTVLNLQLFDALGDDAERQQHGAHSDRVDSTLVVCLDNIGPNGDLVIVNGYSGACELLDLNEHQNFYDNLGVILRTAPHAIGFRQHAVKKGETLMIRSDSTHFITPKTLSDVKAGMAAGQQPEKLGSGQLTLGRGIINMAYESSKCQLLDYRARVIERDPRLRTAGHPRNIGFYPVAEQVIREHGKSVSSHGMSAALARQLLGVMVKRRSATDLYGNETPTP